MRDLEKKKEYNRRYAQLHKAEAIKRTRIWRSNPDNLAVERRRLKDYNRYRKDRSRFLMLRRLRVRGITQEEYEAMVATQGNLCAICKKQMAVPNIDHNHITGKVRELLCRYCNTVLGMCFENLDVLQNAIHYLNKHQEER